MKFIKNASILLIVGGILYFPLFLHLDYAPLYHFDESRNAINAFEMNQNGNYFVRHINDTPDTWETKPPFLVWMQILSMKIVGFDELGVRLPSAIFALLTIALIIWFLYKEFDDLLGGILAAFVLVCSKGYVCIHVTRTGDHDSVLTFFLLLGALSFYKFLEFKEDKNKYLSIATFALIFGVLTKSIAGLFFLPGLFLYTVFRRKLITVFSTKGFYLAIFIFLIFIGGYYLIAEFLHPGHFQVVWENELFPRYFNFSKVYDYKVPESKLYYFNLIVSKQFSYFWILFVLSVLIIFLKKNNVEIKRFSIYMLFCITSFLIVLSIGSVNSWYNAPVFPLLAIIVGLGLSAFCQLFFERIFKPKNVFLQNIFTGIFIVAIFFFPYKTIVESVSFPDNSDQYGKMMEKIKLEKPEDQGYFVFYEYNNSHYIFYEKVYNEIYKNKIESCSVRGSLTNCSALPNQSEKVLICNESYFEEFKTIYNYTTLDQFKNCQYLVVTGTK